MKTTVQVGDRSSQIEEIDYDSEKQELGIVFKRSNSRYIYFDVSEDEYNEFINAESIGRHFGTYIKNVKDWKKKVE